MSVHDLICKAARKEADVDSGPLVAHIKAYINSYQGEMTPSVLREIHICRNELLREDERRGDREPDWLGYALLQMDDTRRGPVDAYTRLGLDPTARLATLLCLIDAREQYSYSIDDREQREGFYKQCIEEYVAAIRIAAGRNRTELLHHLGKAYRRVGREDDALSCFQELVSLEPEWHAARSQIVHLGARKGASGRIKDEGGLALRLLIRQILDDPWMVPLRISMVTVSNLRSYPDFVRELTADAQAVADLADVIAMSALEGLDQFYDAIVAFTSLFAYRHEQLCISLVEALRDMFFVIPESVGAGKPMSACEALANIAESAKRSGHDAEWKKWSELSARYAEVILAAGPLNDFEIRGVAKVFNIAGAPSRALEVILQRAPATDNHWILYRKAEAQLALGLPEALDTARVALNRALEDPAAKRRLASYYDLMSQCFEGIDPKAALANVKLALDAANDDKYRRILEQRLEHLRSLAE